MKLKICSICSIFCLVALLTTGSSAHADTIITLASSSSTTTYAGYFAVNSGTLVTTGAPTTYNLNPDGIWAAPIAGSSWISYNPNTDPAGSVVAPAGTYIYLSQTFIDNTPGVSTGTIQVMADDSTSVYLNGTLIIPAAAPVPVDHCTQGQPNCEEIATYNLTGFVQGVNQLGFGVVQDFAVATGLDYSATIDLAPTAATPEPSSLLMLGTGVLGAAGFLRKRMAL